ncbi:hypothetical protein B0T18DRAFT_391653 [Schizothecium vesticola]|uniref:Protein kinase domain-containing protein n=1 Tax=Schizothecium vesticola TaxID=314040 RepID=A0AA40ENT3_9PEZI|nr:hypothetical protein B0T18DRAFT_391653 [Schizothecium vesticola]
MGDAEAYDRILAILLLMGQERKLHVFMDEGMKMTNGKLPLKKGNLLLNQVEGWGSLEKHGFREQQWKVLAPVLGPETVSQTARHYEFPYDQPLPFVKMDKRQMYERQMEGSFGIVEAITIHEAHSRFSKHTKFAVKWLKSGDKDEFDREVENLERFNHSHIVKLLFTVQSVAEEDKEDKEDKAAKKKVKYLLVFPLAAGTLKDAWSHKWEGCDPKTLSEWMLEQSLGLADGLQHIHNPDLGSNRPDLGPNSYWAKEAKYGIHRDIKPTNILWSGAESSANLGTLQLADLGATSFHHTDTRSNAPGGVETKTYAPPEQELGQPKSRAFDIWSLGCVFLEFLIFIVQRTDVKDASTLAPSFSKERLDEAKRCNSAPHGIHGDAFFTVESNKWTRVARVNLAVVQRIDELFRHRECTYFVHDLLTLIQHGMLVIKAKKDDEESSLRYSIADVCKELTNMVARGKTEHGYFTDKYTPLPETKGPSQGLDGPPPPPPPPPPPESQARHPLQPKPDEEAVPQARRMQRTQHHQTPSAAKRHSGGGRTRLSPLSESAASEDALEQGGPGLNSPIRGAKQPKNTSPSQQAAGREEEHNFHPPRKQRPELTRPSPIDNPLEQTNNQKDEQPEQASDLPRKRPIDNVSEEATTREPEPLVQTPPAPRRERPPNTTPTNPLTDEPLPRSQAGATPPRAAAKGPLSGYSNMKDPSTPPVRKPGPNREKIRADAQLRLQKLQLQSGQGPGKRGPTEAPVAPRTRVTERPEKQGSRLGVSPEEVMKLRARMETNLQSLEGKKGPKQERGSG